MKSDTILASPDESGWYWFKKNKKSDVVIVFVNDDGEATATTEDGFSYILDDLIGLWSLINLPDDF